MWWLSGDVVAQLRSLWLIGDEMAQWGCGGLLEVWWLSGDRGGSVDIVEAHWRCGRCSGSLKMWWLIGDGLVHWSCSGSLEMWWLSQSSSQTALASVPVSNLANLVVLLNNFLTKNISLMITKNNHMLYNKTAVKIVPQYCTKLNDKNEAVRMSEKCL